MTIAIRRDMVDASKEMWAAVKAHEHQDIFESFGAARCYECSHQWYLCSDNPMAVYGHWFWGEAVPQDSTITWHGRRASKKGART